MGLSSIWGAVSFDCFGIFASLTSCLDTASRSRWEPTTIRTSCLDLMSMYVTRPSKRSMASRARVIEAVRGLLEEGSFHATTVEEVADRAGVSRATLYGHFGSRLGLVDAMCETFDAN